MQPGQILERSYGQYTIKLSTDAVQIEHVNDRSCTLTPDQGVNLWLALQAPGVRDISFAHAFYEKLPNRLDSSDLQHITGYSAVTRRIDDVYIYVGMYGLKIAVGFETIHVPCDLLHQFYQAYMIGTELFFFDLDRQLQNDREAEFLRSLEQHQPQVIQLNEVEC